MPTKKKVVRREATAVQVNPPEMPKPGRGQKVCPNCNEIIGAKSGTCPKCQATLTTKSKGKGKSKTGGGSVDYAALRERLAAIQEEGGVEKLRHRIDSVRAELQELEKFGGVDQAEELLSVAEDLREVLG